MTFWNFTANPDRFGGEVDAFPAWPMKKDELYASRSPGAVGVSATPRFSVGDRNREILSPLTPSPLGANPVTKLSIAEPSKRKKSPLLRPQR